MALRSTTRSASVSSDSSSNEPISYSTPERDPATGNPRTTRQLKDWRPVSTFYRKSWKQMSFAELVCFQAVCPEELHELKPESLDRGPLPTQPAWKEIIFIATRGLIPVIVQSASYALFPSHKWPAWAAYPFYFLCFAMRTVERLVAYSLVYGMLDEKNRGRDRIPDRSVVALAKGIVAFLVLRVGAIFYLKYSQEQNPLEAYSWSFPLRYVAWALTLDYLFYVYHRSCHEVGFLWAIHSKHHETKHPTPILAILAGDWQETLEIAILPLCATLLVPMSFYELYTTVVITAYVEIMGHSGIRAVWGHPVLSPLLAPFDCEGVVEDHDLHHRLGRGGKNYGKQSRFFDKLFGTVTPRVEGPNAH